MTKTSLQTGQTGEKIAQSILIRKGFRIEAFNWRAGQTGEIDVIAYHPTEQILAFVEVKTRKGTQYGSPAESVTLRKQQQILTLAEAYLSTESQHNYRFIRFDVISILFPGAGRPAEIQHLENAFSNTFI